MADVKYQRILLKLSGEAFGQAGKGVDLSALDAIIDEIISVQQLGVNVGIVVGAGNLVRGATLAEEGLEKEIGDYMGMMGTVINAMALRDRLASKNIPVKIFSLLSVPDVLSDYEVGAAKTLLDAGQVIIFAGGTGKPFCTTDKASCQRAIDMKVDLLLKATKVDGVYSADPMKDSSATLYESLSYDEILDKQLLVMDADAVEIARTAKIPLCVFNMRKPSALKRIVMGETEGTLVE